MLFGHQLLNKNESQTYVIATIAFILMFYGISVGINLTGFALFLNQEGFSKLQIGRILSMELAGNLMIAPILPKISEYLGIWKLMIIALIVRSLCLIMFAESGNTQEYMIWLFGFGISGFALFASVQYWGTTIAHGANKSTILSILNVAFGIGIATGVGLLLLQSETISSRLFYISVLFSAIVFVPILLSKNLLPAHSKEIIYTSPSKIIQYGQIAILCGLVANYILLALGNFIVLYAMDHGVVYKDAVMINIYMIAGNILLTVPIGMMLDRFNKSISLIIILVFIVAAVSAIPFVITSKLLTMIIFLVISGATGGIYIIGISMLTDKFQAQNLVMANTIMLMMNAIGGFAGVSATGAAIEYWGNQGLIMSLFVLIFFFLLFVVYSLNGKENRL